MVIPIDAARLPAMPTDPVLPADLVATLARLHADRPGSWLEVLADAVVGEGGIDAADLLGMAADRAAAGHTSDAGEGDPEQALANLEADLRALDGPPDVAGPSDQARALDLLAEPPPAPRPGKPSDRNMGQLAILANHGYLSDTAKGSGITDAVDAAGP